MICPAAGKTSEMDIDAELMRIRKDFPSFHSAVASYVLACEKGDPPRKPLGFIVTAIRDRYSEPGACARWDEIRATHIPAAREAKSKRKVSWREAKAETKAAADYGQPLDWVNGRAPTPKGLPEVKW